MNEGTDKIQTILKILIVISAIWFILSLIDLYNLFEGNMYGQ
jgi:hypothetical protein